MEQIGVNSNVLAGGKMFHVQTAGSIVDKLIHTEVYDGGRVIMQQEKHVGNGESLDAQKFQEFLNKFHHEVAWEIELLFYIRDKIKTVQHAVSNNKMGLVFLRKGLVDEAIGEFLIAIEKDPDMMEAYSNLGMAQLQKGLMEEAVATLKKGCEIAPQFADMRNYLGTAYTRARRYNDALEAYQSALRINPTYVEVNLNIAAMHIESIQVAPDQLLPPSIRKRRALEQLDAAVTQHAPFKQERYYASRFERVVREISSEDWPKALTTIEEIKNGLQNPNLDETIHGFYLKFLFGGAGKDEKVLNDYRAEMEKSLADNPQYADLNNSLGLVYLIQCRNLFMKAMQQFKKAHDINPSYKNAFRNFRLVQNDGREFLNLLRAILK